MKHKISSFGETKEIQTFSNVRLLDVLQSHDFFVNAACGGKGTCHKCRVKITEGFSLVTATDKVAFTQAELEEGWRLSCQSVPRTGLSITLPSVENASSKPRLVRLSSVCEQPYWICDLGSTGVVVALCDRGQNGAVVIEAHSLNRQVKFGSDVMTRLAEAQKSGVEKLQRLIFETLELCFHSIVKDLEREKIPGFVFENELDLYLSGNSAMVSFLHGWDISTLAVSPYQPLKTEMQKTWINFKVKIEGEEKNLKANLISLPLLSGFVGADTVAGVLSIEKQHKKEVDCWMLVDIGTNTEIVLKVPPKNQKSSPQDHYWYTSAPAGPAFEGGNISQGMRAEPGALSAAKYLPVEKKWKIETIANDRPKGICGSGLMDVIYQAVLNGLIQKDGFVENGKLQINDSLALVADDIREFQLAKSATRSAIELLCDRAHIRPKVIFLAGTFAQNLNLDSVKGLGLIPSDIKAIQIGNASLQGTSIFATLSSFERESFIQKLKAQSEQIELALQDDFQEIFVKNLNF